MMIKLEVKCLPDGVGTSIFMWEFDGKKCFISAKVGDIFEVAETVAYGVLATYSKYLMESKAKSKIKKDTSVQIES